MTWNKEEWARNADGHPRLSGRPPEGHERQCIRIKRDGIRCGKWACVGSKYCPSHGGTSGYRKQVKLNQLPMFYGKKLTRTLQEALDESLGLKTHEQLNLLQELALMRHAAGEAVGLYSVAQELPPELEKRDELIAEASALMQEQLKAVAAIAKEAALIETARRDAITPADLKLVCNQLVKLLYDICGKEHMSLARAFEERVRTDIKLPNDNEGTTLTPTTDVQQMLDSIPKEDS